jgi:Phosphotransferase enzyme family
LPGLARTGLHGRELQLVSAIPRDQQYNGTTLTRNDVAMTGRAATHEIHVDLNAAQLTCRVTEMLAAHHPMDDRALVRRA